MIFLLTDHNKEKQRGFTLVELMITVVIASIAIGFVFNFFTTQRESYAVQQQVAQMQQNIRAAMDIMARDLRESGYQEPNVAPFIDSITSAQDSSITFETDFDSDGCATTVQFNLGGADGMTVLRNNQPIAENILAMGFAYAYDDDKDGNMETYSVGANDLVIWAYNNGGTWFNLDTDGNGVIDGADGPGIGGNGNIAGTTTGDAFDIEEIRAVRVWFLAQPERPANNFLDNFTYQVGRQTITPNDNFRHRLLSSTIKLRNMGLDY